MKTRSLKCNIVSAILFFSCSVGYSFAVPLKPAESPLPAKKNTADEKKPIAEDQPGILGKLGVRMIHIPAGNGIAAFEIGETEVTQGLWQAVMGNNPSYAQNCGANCPVEKVSWNDVQEFLKKLNVQTGRAYRLPTEQEWAYACLAGTKTEYCGSDNIDAVAWYSDNSKGISHPVKGKQANGFGLYDMSGNVWEWTSDCHGGPCLNRRMRGGSSGHTRQFARADASGNMDVAASSRNIGFRLVRTVP